MADNTAQDGTDLIATDEATTINGAASTGVKVQRTKVGYGNDGSYRDVSADFPLPVREQSDTGTPSVVGSSATVVTILASNANRLGAIIFNDSTATLIIGLFTGASASNLTLKLPPGAVYEIPFGYTGIITGLWDAVNGNARVTEIT